MSKQFTRPVCHTPTCAGVTRRAGSVIFCRNVFAIQGIKLLFLFLHWMNPSFQWCSSSACSINLSFLWTLRHLTGRYSKVSHNMILLTSIEINNGTSFSVQILLSRSLNSSEFFLYLLQLLLTTDTAVNRNSSVWSWQQRSST